MAMCWGSDLARDRRDDRIAMLMQAMLIRTSPPDQIVVELDRPGVALAMTRVPDGSVIAAWLASDSGKIIQFVEVGRA
jgi:hypothetical protein